MTGRILLKCWFFAIGDVREVIDGPGCTAYLELLEDKEWRVAEIHRNIELD